MSNFFNQPPKPAGQASSLFGNATTTQPQQTTSLFGASQQQPPVGNSIFGARPPIQTANQSFGQSTSNNAFFQQPQQQQQNTGLFGASAPAQQPAPSLAQSFLANSQAAPLPRLGQSQWQPAPNPREKPIQQQMFEILNKWHPDSNQSVFQHYFYQNVGAERAPYFGVPEGEDPRKWEEALQKKPSDGSIPVLAKGFGEAGIAGRITTQDAAVKALYERVREIDKSLRDRIEEHDLTFTVRTQEARRKHLALSRRCLGLATKVQVLRNRGYALDSAEEELKDKLAKLEKVTFDPVLKGRQEELWARMTVVRERAKMLKEETERLGKKAGAGDEESIDEETMAKIKQILTSYDAQLAYLRKEVDMIKKDFEDWDAATKPVVATR